MKPMPANKIEIVAAGQSPRGMEFAAEYADYNFVMGSGINTPTAYAPNNQKLLDAAAKTGRDVGAYVLFMVIADETDELAEAKWQKYREGADVDALAWMARSVPGRFELVLLDPPFHQDLLLGACQKTSNEVAAECGVSPATVNNIKRAAGLTKKRGEV